MRCVTKNKIGRQDGRRGKKWGDGTQDEKKMGDEMQDKKNGERRCQTKKKHGETRQETKKMERQDLR